MEAHATYRFVGPGGVEKAYQELMSYQWLEFSFTHEVSCLRAGRATWKLRSEWYISNHALAIGLAWRTRRLHEPACSQDTFDQYSTCNRKHVLDSFAGL
jgi:hypothetical protein